jgi:hypothetical protein
VLGDAVIEGVVLSEGSAGISSQGTPIIVPGGAGGAGGSRGGAGNPNGTMGESPCGAPGESPPEVEAAGVCPDCGAPRAGGGCGGVRDGVLPSGGSGGGHATEGEGPGGGIAYGNDAITNLRIGGSGGGGGGNTAGDTFASDLFGGSGGGGGGVIAFEVGQRFTLSGRISVAGGRGGNGAPLGGGGGGGGSGGALRIRAASAEFFPSAELVGVGGSGGRSPFDFGLPGRAGAPGRVRIETLEPPSGLGCVAVADPAPSVGDLVLSGTVVSIGASLHYDTIAANPRYEFDGADPETGAMRARSGDVAFADGIPRGSTGRIEFFGADEDAAAPGSPDLATEIGPVTNVAFLDGKRFIRYRIEFVVDVAQANGASFAIERLSIRFRRR